MTDEQIEAIERAANVLRRFALRQKNVCALTDSSILSKIAEENRANRFLKAIKAELKGESK